MPRIIAKKNIGNMMYGAERSAPCFVLCILAKANHLRGSAVKWLAL